MRTLLITGFGPFPSAPFNSTAPLIEWLARARRPALAEVTVATHVFATGYAAVERELPTLIARHQLDALLMFRLAPRAKTLRVETRARNALALLPDAGGKTMRHSKIAPGGPSTRALPALARGRSCRQAGRAAARRLHPRALGPPRPAVLHRKAPAFAR